jgi:hypothetical protein
MSSIVMILFTDSKDMEVNAVKPALRNDDPRLSTIGQSVRGLGPEANLHGYSRFNK